jgi:hypothetical protein
LRQEDVDEGGADLRRGDRVEYLAVAEAFLFEQRRNRGKVGDDASTDELHEERMRVWNLGTVRLFEMRGDGPCTRRE